MTCPASGDQPMIQWIVRFSDQSFVVNLPLANQHPGNSVRTHQSHDQIQQSHLRKLWSDRTGWPQSSFIVTCWDFPFCSLRVKSSIKGGKGGFGTLLKGQSRQAGAKLTTDFGACRDLQGRRLRHVNDEIKLRQWKEIQRKEAAGEEVPQDVLWKTPSGIYNWHLMTPTWADISKKATHKIKRQFQKMDQQAHKEAMKQLEREKAYQNSMDHYLEQATAATEKIQQSIGDAIQQGLLAAAATASHPKKRKLSTESTMADYLSSEPNSLVTLSGVLVVDECSQGGFQFQSKSDFGTAILVLDRAAAQAAIVYYEVTLVTGGMAQIGWASLLGDNKPFTPNNDLGDGVGDDSASYAVDGTRKLKFHAGIEEAYDLEWKEGDRLGCWVNTNDGTIGFSINGRICGNAFQIDDKSLVLVPAFSCNQGQILRLHTTQKDCMYFPKDSIAIAVGDLVVTDIVAAPDSEEGTKKPAPASPTSKKAPEFKMLLPPMAAPVPKKEIKPEFLDLTVFNSAQELEELGPDRLMAALLALNVKCGGTLSERATRLFLLKGLERKEYPKKVRSQGFEE